MDFQLSKEQQLAQQMIREFVEKEVKPLAMHTDHTHEFPWSSIRKMGPLGLLGLNLPEAWGGAGADHISAAILIEELGRGCGSQNPFGVPAPIIRDLPTFTTARRDIEVSPS